MADWSHELILEFLDVYKNEPVLWDPTHPLHKDKTKTNEAWLRLSDILQRPVSELKKKKDSLMATFRGHLRKKKASIKSGNNGDDIYKPVWFAYETMESFLGPVYECTTIVDAQDAIETYVIGPDDDDDDGDTERVVNDLVPIMTATSSSTIHPTIIRRRSPPKIQEQEDDCNNATNKRGIEEDDECDLFAKILAKKLRKLPEPDRFLFMYEIDGLFLNKLCGDSCTLTRSISYNHVPTVDYLNGPSTSQPQNQKL